MFLFPFSHNFTVKMNIQKVKNSNTIYLANPLLPKECILPFPAACGLFAQLPADDMDSTSKMLLLWDFGMLRQAGTNPPARFIWTSLQEESNYCLPFYQPLQDKSHLPFFNHHIHFYLHFNLIKKKKKAYHKKILWETEEENVNKGEDNNPNLLHESMQCILKPWSDNCSQQNLTGEKLLLQP